MSEYIPGELAEHGQGYEDWYESRRDEEMELGTTGHDDYNYKVSNKEIDQRMSELFDDSEDEEDDENSDASWQCLVEAELKEEDNG